MIVARLKLDHFRCFTEMDFRPDAGVNLILGDNASGKSSVLEALFYLGRGRSFRQSNSRDAIQHGHDMFTVHGEVSDNGGASHRLAVQRSRHRGTRFRHDDDRDTTRLDLINALPLQIIDPNVHRLLEQGPSYRRQFMDWGVFHVEHDFFPAWRRYRRALKQRNRALKSRWPLKDIVTWDAELVRHGEIVNACRRAYVRQIDGDLPESTRRILGDERLVLSYDPGWRGDQGLGTALATSLEGDRRAGSTQQGPHRADLRIKIESIKARDWISRGQQKVLTTALLLVQARLLQARRSISPILLIDDMAAELGTGYRETLAAEIKSLQLQSFLTFLDESSVPVQLKRSAVFHVEQGYIQVHQ